ncbi:MAG: metallophosphoesterase [Deltaproteobacteria bacterium]|nr:metallophosphoesterase [Deltaproteobacteria bacterium]
MENERIFIVGDIHGCLDMLKRLMERLDWRPEKDRLIFLGDYVDRGRDSRGVIDYILKIMNTSQRVECLMGNHEMIFLDFLSGTDVRTFLANGGACTLESYRRGEGWRGNLQVPEEHVLFLKSLKPWIELEDYYVVHAGLRPGVDIRRQNLEDLVWIRDPFIYSKYDFGKRVIFGHTPFSTPLIMENKIGLDTGAVFGNRLTCLELPSLVFHHVEA